MKWVEKQFECEKSNWSMQKVDALKNGDGVQEPEECAILYPNQCGDVDDVVKDTQ